MTHSLLLTLRTLTTGALPCVLSNSEKYQNHTRSMTLVIIKCIAVSLTFNPLSATYNLLETLSNFASFRENKLGLKFHVNCLPAADDSHGISGLIFPNDKEIIIKFVICCSCDLHYTNKTGKKVF